MKKSWHTNKLISQTKVNVYLQTLTQWVVSDFIQSVLRSNCIKGFCRLHELETIPSLLSTGWFKECIWGWFHNQTKVNLGSNERLTFISNKLPHLTRVINEYEEYPKSLFVTGIEFDYIPSTSFEHMKLSRHRRSHGQDKMIPISGSIMSKHNKQICYRYSIHVVQ